MFNHIIDWIAETYFNAEHLFFCFTDKQIDLKNTDLKKLRVKQLKKILNDFDEDCIGCVEKSDYVKKIQNLMKEHTEL